MKRSTAKAGSQPALKKQRSNKELVAKAKQEISKDYREGNYTKVTERCEALLSEIFITADSNTSLWFYLAKAQSHEKRNEFSEALDAYKEVYFIDSFNMYLKKASILLHKSFQRS